VDGEENVRWIDGEYSRRIGRDNEKIEREKGEGEKEGYAER